MKGQICSITIYSEEEYSKENMGEAIILKDKIEGDAQNTITCIDAKEIEEMSVYSGDFKENMIIKGLDFSKLTIGNRIKLGEYSVLEVAEITKEKYKDFKIDKVFLKVIRGGKIRIEDPIEIL